MHVDSGKRTYGLQHVMNIILMSSLDALLVAVGHMLLLKVDRRLEEVCHPWQKHWQLVFGERGQVDAARH